MHTRPPTHMLLRPHALLRTQAHADTARTHVCAYARLAPQAHTRTPSACVTALRADSCARTHTHTHARAPVCTRRPPCCPFKARIPACTHASILPTPGCLLHVGDMLVRASARGSFPRIGSPGPHCSCGAHGAQSQPRTNQRASVAPRCPLSGTPAAAHRSGRATGRETGPHCVGCVGLWHHNPGDSAPSYSFASIDLGFPVSTASSFCSVFYVFYEICACCLLRPCPLSRTSVARAQTPHTNSSLKPRPISKAGHWG
jgi:hypothetical protein